MATIPASITEFLTSRRIAVAGVSRDRRQPANAIFRRLRDTGHKVVPINPRATELEGVRCYPDLASAPEAIEAVMIVTAPRDAVRIVGEARQRGITRIWFHRAFGSGSVSAEAVEACRAAGIEPIVGACPMMYTGDVDVPHRCARWWLGVRGRAPR